ncbi:hypothetical protein DFR71_6672 [Nocardia alba]|uniref:Uncharacterized protein n=1 Tax=Nocardia alba TaxID=225051 RepID=A0A4R1F436_9NOCA|nr:hypothetical protein DFR71_6672 [Nocardia alba]
MRRFIVSGALTVGVIASALSIAPLLEGVSASAPGHSTCYPVKDPRTGKMHIECIDNFNSASPAVSKN